MAEKKIIAVVGATGAQGGGLVRAILADKNGGFAHARSRGDVNSDKAKELASSGAEVVAQLRRCGESEKGVRRRLRSVLRHIFLGALFPEKELAEATAWPDAPKHAGIQHVIWSTLEDTRRWVLAERPHHGICQHSCGLSPLQEDLFFSATSTQRGESPTMCY